MKRIILLPALLLLLLFSACTRQSAEHPYVERGMSRTEVTNIMGAPVRVDSIQHVLTFNLGHMSSDILDSLRRTLDESEAGRMLMGHPVDSSLVNIHYFNWYYGPEVIDTMFTFDSTESPKPGLDKFWYVISKQRAVTFDGDGGRVTARGFLVLKVAQR
ncbi:MAG: hypothetical protein WB699_07570 [Bacteroidota bacterium]